MRLPVPGPRDVLHLIERGAEAVDLMLAAAPRAMALLDRMDELIGRVDTLVEGIERTRESADAVVRRTEEVVTEAQEIIGRTGGVVTGAEQVVGRSDAVVTGAERVVEHTGPLTERLERLLDSVEPPLTRLQPTLERLAETTDPTEVDALVTLVDHLPGLALKMETDIVPILETLGTVAPDVHDLLDVMRELNEMLGSIPGLGRVKRRIDEEQEAEGRG